MWSSHSVTLCTSSSISTLGEVSLTPLVRYCIISSQETVCKSLFCSLIISTERLSNSNSNSSKRFLVEDVIMAELIVFMELRFQIGCQGSRMQRMYADLYAPTL